MASSTSRGGERMIHQDYIARIRYSNALPPPPNPPKLLDIPNTGLASGQYTNPGFASRLARDQPLNIEADAELGMPLDLVGMPGIFDGDESSIQAPLNLPVPHPHDRALLRPLSSLGKPKFSDSGVSFLRRTEYISSYQSKSRFDSTTSKSLIDKTGVRAKKTAFDLDKESPEYIKTQVARSFDVAASYLKEPSRIRHPTKRNVQLLEANPLLPDREAFPDAGGFINVKFLTNPVPPSSTYDVRLESGLLVPIDKSEAEQAMEDAIKEAYERDPERNSPPEESLNYDLLLTKTTTGSLNFKRKFSFYDPERSNESLYSDRCMDDQPCFRFKRVRSYESATTVNTILEKYDEEVMLATHDGTDGIHQKAAYYYPIIQRVSIRPQRNKNIHKLKYAYTSTAEEVDTLDAVDMVLEDEPEDLAAIRLAFKDHPHGPPEETEKSNEVTGNPAKETAGISASQEDDDDQNSD